MDHMKLSIFLCGILTAMTLPAATSAQGDLLARMSAVNAGLHSYTATLKAHVTMSTFPFLQTDVEGTYYHKDPDLSKLEITSGLPGIAQQFGKLYPRIEPPSRWNDVFNVRQVSDDGRTARFVLVPKKEGNVDRIDATIDDASATVSSMTWNYKNGGTAQMNEAYSMVKGYKVVTAQTGNVDEPSYKGTISATLSDYSMNPPLSDSVFAQQ
jgi:outer membrane lipoprotein-sorting protein